MMTEVDAETLDAVASLAAERGISAERLAGEMIREAVAGEADLSSAIQEGRRQIAAGEGLSHDELIADLQRWKRERRRAA